MYSSHSTMSRATGWTTETVGGGGAACGAVFPQPATRSPIMSTAVPGRLYVFIRSSGSLSVCAHDDYVGPGSWLGAEENADEQARCDALWFPLLAAQRGGGGDQRIVFCFIFII